MTVRTGDQRRTTARPALVAIGALVVFLLFAVLAVIRWHALRQLDAWAPAAGHAAALRSGVLRGVAKVITDLGSPLAVDIVGLLAVAWWAWRRKWWWVAAVLVARGGEQALESLAKAVVGRARPHLAPLLTSASNSSFPSGHAAGSTAVYGTVALLVAVGLSASARRWLIGSTAAFVVLVGASRVVLGVHYPTDVLAGFALGVAWVAMALIVASMGGRQSH